VFAKNSDFFVVARKRVRPGGEVVCKTPAALAAMQAVLAPDVLV
jgi:hypothetical protein